MKPEPQIIGELAPKKKNRKLLKWQRRYLDDFFKVLRDSLKAARKAGLRINRWKEG